MASLQDCLQDVIAQGQNYFIRSSIPAGAHGAREWAPAALLADLRRDAPGLLQDHAWLEWSLLPDGSRAGAIHYGVAGASLGYQEVPGYGRLHALDQSQRRPISAGGSSDASRPLDGLVLGPWPDRDRPMTGMAAAGDREVPQGRPRPGRDGLAACRELSREGPTDMRSLHAPAPHRPRPLG